MIATQTISQLYCTCCVEHCIKVSTLTLCHLQAQLLESEMMLRILAPSDK